MFSPLYSKQIGQTNGSDVADVGSNMGTTLESERSLISSLYSSLAVCILMEEEIVINKVEKERA